MFRLFLFLLLFATVAMQAQNTDSLRVTVANPDVIGNETLVEHKNAFSNIDPQYTAVYQKPTFWQIIKYIPDDLYQFGRFTTRTQNLKWDALAVGSTAALLPFDQDLLEGADYLGKRLGGWDKDSEYKKVGGLLNIIPQNISSAVYYIGNGGTTVLLSGMFYGIGKLNNNDLRALNTSNELLECLLSVGVATQTIKRVTGRQSPSRAIPDNNPGGKWQPFPSFAAFQNNTPNYDAMPSGHLATYVATVTIIAINYPEKRWIRPVGYAVGGILAFNMVSTKVHWVSDYPIAILIGYVMGKTIAERRITKLPKEHVGLAPLSRYKINYTCRTVNRTLVFGTRVEF